MKTVLLALGMTTIAAAACGGAQQAEPPKPAASAPMTFHQQAAAGQKLFGEHCASCHGASGNDGKAPKLVGLKNGALPLDPPPSAKVRKASFKTVADIADFVVHAMPPGSAGTLPEDQYWDILAFDLQANGIDLGDKKLDPALAATLAVPR
jgi:cytochrome c